MLLAALRLLPGVPLPRRHQAKTHDSCPQQVWGSIGQRRGSANVPPSGVKTCHNSVCQPVRLVLQRSQCSATSEHPSGVEKALGNTRPREAAEVDPLIGQLLEPVVTALLGRARDGLRVPPEEQALGHVISEHLRACLRRQLIGLPPPPAEVEDSIVERLAEIAAAAGLSIDNVAGTTSDTMLSAAERLMGRDWATLGVYDNAGIHQPLDLTALFEDFAGTLELAIIAGSRTESSLIGVANDVNFHNVSMLCREVLALLRKLDGASGRGPEVIVERASRTQKLLLSRRKAFTLSTDPYVEPRHLGEWNRWCGEVPWAQRILDDIEEVEQVLEAFEARGDARTALRQLRLAFADGGPYSTLLVTLRDSRLSVVDAEVAALKRDTGDVAPVEHARRSLSRIRREADDPRYQCCFAVTGSTGAGTTHLLLEMLTKASERGDLFVIIETHDTSDFETALLQSVSKRLGTPVETLADLRPVHDQLQRTGRILHLVGEDLEHHAEKPRLMRALPAVIDATTEYLCIRWLLTSNLDSFDSVQPEGVPGFWRTYGEASNQRAHEEGAAIGGWRNLDVTNAADAVGLRLLHQLADPEDEPEVVELLKHLNDFQGEQSSFANPLPAKLRWQAVRAGEKDRPITDAQDPKFAELLWAHLLSKGLEQEKPAFRPVLAAQLEQAVQQMCDRLISGSEGVKIFPPSPGLEDIDPNHIIRLQQMSLVSQPSSSNRQDLYVRPRHNSFWGLRIAEALSDSANPSAESGDHQLSREEWIDRWKRRAKNGDQLAQSVCQYLLGIAAGAGTLSSGELWRTWLRDPSAPREPLLMAAAAAPQEFNGLTLRRVSRLSYRPESRREAFVLLRLLGSARNAHWEADQRLRVLGQHWGLLADLELNSYAAYVVQRILRAPGSLNEDNFFASFEALLGCEVAGVSRIAANVLHERAVEIFGSRSLPRITVALYRYLSGRPPRRIVERNERGRRRNQGGQRQNTRPDLAAPDRDALPDHFTEILLRHQFNEAQPAAALRRLAASEWWSLEKRPVPPVGSRINRGLAMRMEAQAAIAFGYCAHSEGPSENFAKVIDDIVAGRLLQEIYTPRRLTVALYMIKHSVVTRARWNLLVDPSLHPALLALASSDRLPSGDRKNLDTLLACNGLDPRQAGARK